MHVAPFRHGLLRHSFAVNNCAHDISIIIIIIIINNNNNSFGEYLKLAFTRPNAGREVARLLRARALGARRRRRAVSQNRTIGQRAWPRLARAEVVSEASAGERAKPVPPVPWPPCRFSTAYFLEIGNFAPFSEFLHIKGRHFPKYLYPFKSTYDP